MTTHDRTPSSFRKTYPADMETPLYAVYQNQLECAVDNMTAADLERMLDVYKGDVIIWVALEVVIAAGAAMTVDLGDGNDLDGYADGVNINVTAGTRTVYPCGVQYSADDTIDMTVNHTNAVGTIEVSAMAVQVPYIV